MVSAITCYKDNWKRKAEILDSIKIDVITIKDITKDSHCGTKN